MATNVDILERDEFKETYNAILALETYVKNTLAANEPWHPNDVIEAMDRKVARVKKVFLTRE